MSPVLLLPLGIPGCRLYVLLVAGECIEGPRRTHQERPGPMAMSPVQPLQQVLLVAGDGRR